MGKPPEVQLPDKSQYDTCQDYADAVLNTLNIMESNIYASLKQLTAKRINLYTKLINAIEAKIPAFDYKISEVASQYLVLPEVKSRQMSYPKLYYGGILRTYRYCKLVNGETVCNVYALPIVPELTYEASRWQDMVNAIKDGLPDFHIRGYMYMRLPIDEGGYICDAKWCYDFAKLLYMKYTISPSSIEVLCPDSDSITCDLGTVLGNDTGIGAYKFTQSTSHQHIEIWYSPDVKFGLMIMRMVAQLELQTKIPDTAELPDTVNVSSLIALPVYCYEKQQEEPLVCVWTPYSQSVYKHNIFFSNVVLDYAMGILYASLPNARLAPFVFVVGTNAYSYEDILMKITDYENIKPVARVVEGLYRREFIQRIYPREQG